jgi:hypothetical protein
MGYDQPPNDYLFSYHVQLETRVRKDHPLRKMKELIDFDFIYSEVKKTYGDNGNELMLYCEDGVAATLIKEALPEELRLRVAIQPVGSNKTVISQGVSHSRSGFPMNYLCVLDGDCSEADMQEWIRAERGEREDIQPPCLRLPGDGLPPERWVLEQLEFEPYQVNFSREFGCTVPNAQAYIQALRVELDHHDLGFSLYQRTNADPVDCVRRTMASVAPVHPQLEELRQRIRQILDPV